MVKTFSTFSTNSFAALVRLVTFAAVMVACIAGQAAFAANITLSPSSGSYTVGKAFTVDIALTNNQDNINAVSGALLFPSESLQVVSLSKAGSLLGLWAEEPAFSNTNGTVSFEGVSLNPGFTGTSGKVLSVTFKPKQSGKAVISMKSGSVLANDGNATNVLGSLGSASFTVNDATEKVIEPETPNTPTTTATPTSVSSSLAVISSSYPDSTMWYSTKEASFTWSLPSNVTAVRTLYDGEPASTPTKVFTPPISNRSFTVDSDGVMYMHVQAKTSSGWGPVSHYKFQVDGTAPENVKVSFTDGNSTTNPSPAILITGTDALSGLDHVTMAVDGQDPVSYRLEPSNLYHLPKQGAGKHSAVISLYDKAGNATQVSLEYSIQVITIPVITSYTRHVELGGTLGVEGNTYPDTTVEIALTDSDGKVKSQNTVSDEKGRFVFSWEGKLATGVYEMRARAQDSKGATSEFTDTHVVTLEQLALIRVGIFIMNWLSVVLVIVLGIITVIATLWYAFLEFARFRRKIRRTLTDVENTLKTNVQALRRDTEEFHTLLVKAEKKRELTKEEQAILKKFKKRLEITEQEIEKKLEQIG
jgi:hypothetical protein